MKVNDPQRAIINGGARTIAVRALLLAIACIFSFLTSHAVARGDQKRATTSGPLTVSLITCYPGPEIYELCGHEAIRIRGEGIDSVWNYGIFDYNEPHFVYRFVKGETDYLVGGYPFAWFLPEYMARGSRVVEQDLNLTPAEAADMRRLLQKVSLPPANRYRYNYIHNNCATRIVDDLDRALGENILYTDTTAYGTYRDAMRGYHRNYPWYQFGIDLVLGSGLDVRMSPRQEMFVPVEMSRHIAAARLSDGRPLVSRTRVLYEGRDDAVLPPTPWWQTPMAASMLLFVISVAVAMADNVRRKVSRWWYALFYLLLGLAGCVVTFLVFLSDHAATSPNLMILWLNPLQLAVPALIWAKSTRPAVRAMMWLNICMMLVLLLAWPFQAQSASPAIFPVMASNLVLAGAYSLIPSSGARAVGKTPAPKRKRTTRKRK